MSATQTLEIRDLRVDLTPVTSLTPYARNARTHSKKQVRQIADSIKTFGWTIPILIDENGRVIAGHGRLEAARSLCLKEVPVVRISDLSEDQKKAYTLADNKLALNAGWDTEILSSELNSLLDVDVDFSIETIGFEMGEIDVLLDGEDPRPEPPVPSPISDDVISKVGDVWQLGRHRLMCGDALDPQSYEKLLEGEQVDATFTDPPFNVPVDGHVCGLGAIKHGEFPMASGEMTDEQFCRFLRTVCERINEVSKPGAVAFMCMDWRHIADLIRAGEITFGDLINLIVWDKGVGGMGSLYRSQHELFAVFRSAGAPHRNNVQLGKHGRNRTNVWTYPGVQARKDDLKLHPTVKPIAMVADAIKDVTARGDLILDPFSGSGTTLLAAEETGRRAACIELDPKYVDLTIRRFEAATGQHARPAKGGLEFRYLS